MGMFIFVLFYRNEGRQMDKLEALKVENAEADRALHFITEQACKL